MQLAKDFGTTESCLRNGLKTADVEDGISPRTTKADSEDLKELKRRNSRWDRRTRIRTARRPASLRRS